MYYGWKQDRRLRKLLKVFLKKKKRVCSKHPFHRQTHHIIAESDYREGGRSQLGRFGGGLGHLR